MGRTLTWSETFSGNLTCPGWQRPWKALDIVPGLVSVPECTRVTGSNESWALVPSASSGTISRVRGWASRSSRSSPQLTGRPASFLQAEGLGQRRRAARRPLTDFTAHFAMSGTHDSLWSGSHGVRWGHVCLCGSQWGPAQVPKGAVMTKQHH